MEPLSFACVGSNKEASMWFQYYIEANGARIYSGRVYEKQDNAETMASLIATNMGGVKYGVEKITLPQAIDLNFSE